MNELQIFNNETQTVLARSLHKALDVTERFSSWFDRQLQFGFIENEDFVGCKTFNTLAHQELQDYEISIDMAKHICMVQRNEKSKEVRQYLIDLEKAWNTPEQVMARALKVADKTIASLSQQITEMKPKAIFADAVSASDSSILVRDLAKIIKQNGVSIGEKRLYKWFRENGYVCQTDTSPTQKAMNLGLFEIVVRTVDKGYGLPKETRTTKVTGKGQQYFINKFLNKEGE